MKSKIFISVGTAYIDKQKNFVDAVLEWIRSAGYEPVMLGKTVYPDKQPLKFIQERMSECDGTLVIAFERMFVNNGEEKRGSTDCKELNGQIIPTVWNQIETAMAFGLGQPILVLSEEGSRREGLLDQCFDWLVFPIKVDQGAVETRSFAETMKGWLKQVDEFRLFRETKRPIAIPDGDPCRLKVWELVRLLSVGQIVKLITGFIATLAAIMAIYSRFANHG